MPATDRLRYEQAFHDWQAEQRAATFHARPHALRFRDRDYLDHEPWIRPAFARLGPVVGQRVLDYGCGHGMASVLLSRWGATVTACDLSAGYLREVRRRERANEADVQLVQADAERLPFAAGAFDAVWGHAILHHLDVPAAAAELRRVVRPGGRVVLCEPWGENPLLRWARHHLPYPGKEHTPDETPLRWSHVHALRQSFAQVRVYPYQLLGMVRRALPLGVFGGPLDTVDDWLLRAVPRLGQFARYVVLVMQ